ncbi:MAG: ABC transporter permease [Prevotella sp.]|jgi:ABC-2 type transport system permease protein|nr:ABC transporter permease [Prevotella sp.]MCI1731043.1 ABC transporter permease [Prevotella sp.]
MDKNEGLLNKILNGLRDMCYIWAKEIRSTVTDEGVLIFFILVPLGYPLLYSWIYNNEVVREVPIAIVDQSHSQTSREFIRDVDASPDTKVVYYCNSVEEAKDLIGKQQVYGILYFPKDFATKLFRSEQAHVSLYCEMSLMLTYKAIYQTTQAAASKINSNIQITQSKDFTNRDDEITTKPLDFVEVPIFNSTGGYGNAIIPGVLILILQQTLLLGIGLGAGTARENNRYKDLVPISRHYIGIFRIVLGKSMCYFMIYSVIAAYITMCVPRFFHYTTLASGIDLLGLMVPFITSVIFFGMALSCLVRYRENVMLLVIFTSVPLLFMSGISWPQADMPDIWQAIAYIFPSTFGIRGFLRISSMGGTLSDIQPEVTALWIQTIAYFSLTCAVYRFQINHTRKHAYEKIEILKNKAIEAKKKNKKAEE